MFNLSPVEMLIQGLILLLAAIPNLLTLVALVDAIRVPQESDYRAGSKVVWVLVLIFFNCVGAAIYYAVGKPRGGRI